MLAKDSELGASLVGSAVSPAGLGEYFAWQMFGLNLGEAVSLRGKGGSLALLGSVSISLKP